ncbi:MAG: winged helix-turn-helix transcriptional regulator [Clostridia bacterium]|nr:winged helix-turn-helix transcriptional regulator [Clostridia bacterium]NCC75506.1 winged helix-turn-helix transcriptional regulator [Clostridia bacterium]
MTNREEELLALIRRNPAISQNELAAALGITRSSVAVHITNLMKKGLILGKGYLLRQEDYVCVLGGSNIDISGFPNQKLVLHDSNPGKVKISLGGVGRNIADNLVHLGVPTKLISATGEDVYGKKLIGHANDIGLDVRHSLILSNRATSTYLAILDETGDMKVAISHMDIFEDLSIDFIQTRRQVIEDSKICVIDTNIPTETISYVVDNFKNTEFFLDTVSTTKALKIKDKIGAFHTIKPNKIEAELLSGLEIRSERDLVHVSEYFLDKGVQRVFITLAESGVFYHDGTEHALIPSPKVNVVNATGAGDAFVSALVFARFNQYEMPETARFAMAASVLALRHEETINPSMSRDNVLLTMKELGLDQ